MRRLPLRALVALVVALLVTGSSLAATRAVNAAAPRQSGETSPCLPEQNQMAYPRVLLLGETVDVTLTVKAVCAAESYPLHVALALDASTTMAGAKNAALRRAVRQLIDELDFANHPLLEMAIVKFDSSATTLCPLTNDAGRLTACVGRIDANGNTAIDAGIKLALRELVAGRPKDAPADSVNEVMVVLSDGLNNAGPGAVIRAANQAKGQGVLLMTVCVGGDCDAPTMRQAASSPRYFFQVDEASGIAAVFIKLRDAMLRIVLKRLTVTDLLAPNMQYVEGSASPAPDERAGDGLTWTTSLVPSDGITLSYRVRPLAPGQWPVSSAAVGELVDNQRRTRGFDFRVPELVVLQPWLLASPPPPSPSPTATPSPTPTHSPTPSPTASATPTPRPTPTRVPGPVFLPIALNERCEIHTVFADVALVLDLSTSMDRPTSAGRSKLAATLAAARSFLALVDLSPDEAGRASQIAVVGFNRRAWTAQPLSRDRAALLAALDGLAARREEGTRLDLAFGEAERALFAAGHDLANTPVAILLTDGLPNQVPPGPDGSQAATVLAAAARLKAHPTTDPARPVRVFTIGLGRPTDVDAPLLAACASDESDFYYEADAEDLARVYHQIAFQFGCPEGRHDWGRPWP